jgi:hypothetical protein
VSVGEGPRKSLSGRGPQFIPCQYLSLIAKKFQAEITGKSLAEFYLGNKVKEKAHPKGKAVWVGCQLPVLTPAILATQEAEIRRTVVQSQPLQIVLETLSKKLKKKKNT